MVNTAETLGRIMVVEDEAVVAVDLHDTLEDLGYSVVATVASGADAIAQARTLRPAAILMDIRLSGMMDGIQAAEQIRSEQDIPIVYLTAHSNDDTLQRAMATEPFGYIVKPFKSVELRCAIEVALHKHEIVARMRARERWLANTLRSIGDGAEARDARPRTTFLNPVAEALTGWKVGEGLGQTLDGILSMVTTHEETAHASRGVDGVVEIGARAVGIMSDLGGRRTARGTDGERVAVVEVSPRDDLADGEVADVEHLNAEIERRVVERTLQLEAANKELEAFSLSVAHDLRAPLRGIEGFSQLLIEEHAGRLDPEGLDHLVTVREAAQRMHRLIDDLLRLAWMARAELRRGEVDVSQLARDVVERLRARDPRRMVNVEIADAVVANGDARLLGIALENLIDNAWKYTSKRDGATIRVGMERQGDAAVYFVGDNGVGFDLAQAGKLFAAFHRFHASSEFEGTGIGLTTVQRIVHRHGGRIWANSSPDAGATFYFVL